MQAFPAPGAGFGRIVHIAYLVPDMDAAMAHWTAQAGVGPWLCFRNIDMAATYEGKPIRLRIHEGLAYVGDMQIQLVQSLNDPAEDTPYAAMLRAGRYGMHHVACISPDIERDIARAEAQGWEAACRMEDADGHRYVYCRSRAMPEVWWEFLEEFPALTQMYRDGIAAAAAWGGSNPVNNIDYGAR